MKFRITKILFVLLFTSKVLIGQIVPFKNYTIHDNLPSNVVTQVLQDKKGYIWMASDAGLTAFDGYNCKVLSIEHGLSDNYIKCLALDSDGAILCGTETGGIFKVDDNRITQISSKNGLFEGAVSRIFVDNKNNIWVCSEEEAISIIEKDTIRTFTNENSTLESTLYCHYLARDGRVWIGNWDGLYVFDTSFVKNNHPLLKNLIVWDVIEDKQGRIWVASQDDGVFCLQGDSVIHYSMESGMTTNTTLALLEDSKGRILVGTYDGGVNIIDSGNVVLDFASNEAPYSIWQLIEDRYGRVWGRTPESGVVVIQDSLLYNYTKENSLASDFVWDIYEDSFHNIWIATEEGVSKYGKAFFDTYQSKFYNNDAQILSVHVNEKGWVFAGSYSGLTLMKDDGGYGYYSSENGLPEEAIVASVVSGSESGVWIGTKGLAKLDKNKLKYYKDSLWTNSEDDILFLDLVELNNTIYAATNWGLIAYKAGNFELYTTDSGLVSNSLNTVAVDKLGRIWCGTRSGLSVFWKGKFYNYTTEHGLPNNTCNEISFDNRDLAWIGTEYGLCSASLSESFVLSTKNYSQEDGLNSMSIYSVLPDKSGNIWIGHNHGVDRLNPNKKAITNYGAREGFIPLENSPRAISKDSDGNIWFGTNDGVVKYIARSDYINEIPPKVFIKAINLYNDTTSLSKYYTNIDSVSGLPADLTLHYAKRNIYFDYVGLHYTIVEKNKYTYRLYGYEDRWSEPTTEIKSIPYQKLSPGKYTFQVKAANCDGIMSTEPAEFSFRILPPWWQTTWAILVQVILAIGLFLLIINWRIRKLKRDKRILTQKVKERTLEIEKQKEHIESQRDEISKQKQEITDSIKYAEHIQSAILPKDETLSEYLDEYFILFKPRDIVSGDFYWFNQMDNKIFAIAADCTGHGVPGAFMSMLGVANLNQIASRGSQISSNQVLNELREKIITTLSHTRKNEQARDGMDLAMCIIDLDKMEAQFSGAYNPLVLVRSGEAQVYKGDKMPVGAMPGELKEFSSTMVKLQKGDCLYMYSDGYADQFGGAEGKKFMSAKFRRLLCEISSKGMQEQKQILDDTIIDWMKNEKQIDDILVIGIRV